jgi:adenylate kinase family enzyme
LKRVLIIGCSGAGKSTLSRQIAPILNLPLYHLDKLYWKPGWVEPGEGEWESLVKEYIAKDSWIIEGNYTGTLPIRAHRADTIIYLNFPTPLCLYRVLKRIVQKKERPDMGEGCEERLDYKFLKWVATFRKHVSPRIEKILEENKKGKKIFELKSKKEAENLLSQIKNKIIV